MLQMQATGFSITASSNVHFSAAGGVVCFWCKCWCQYCSISINSARGVTCDQLDEISPPASPHVTWDKPEILAYCQGLQLWIIESRHGVGLKKKSHFWPFRPMVF
jgi:hypothetical protein